MVIFMAQMNGRWKGLARLLAFATVILGGVLLARFTTLGEFLSREGVVRAVSLLRSSPLAPLIFVPVYAGAVALAVPGTILTLAGGAVFGLWWGTAFNWLGATIGANLAYLLARFLGREGIVQLLGDKAERWPAMERLHQAVQRHGFRGMLTLRLIPVVPFNALNFGGGLVGMGWPAFALATGIGILPGTFIYTMLADALLEGSTRASREAFIRMAVAGTLLVFLSFLPVILRKLKVRVPALAAQGDPEGNAPPQLPLE
ncbi:MAG: TVP38/TMEM64 family protein [Longimicrobiales bacterium]